MNIDNNDVDNNREEVSVLDQLVTAQRPITSSPSDSASSLPLIAEHLHHHEEQQHRHSLWEYESTTPMTTRPHFQRAPSPIHRRIRSKSLGAEVEAARCYDTTSMLLPPLNREESAVKNGYIPYTTHSPLLGKEKLPGTSTMSPAGVIPSQRKQSRQQQQQAEEIEAKNPVWICILYGMINATIVLPVLMSFGSIIYRDNAFAPYMPVLVKLTVVSGVVHQLCFSTFSSLPFAVGQVQDAGLIFLSSMASNLVQYCRRQDNDDETMLATVTVGLALGTALLGCGLVGVGYLRLGQYVQLLPTSVVGGYLAYIGWFCGMSGIALMAGSSELTPRVFVDKLLFIFPGIAGGIAIYSGVTKLNHMAALPISILLEIILFYCILWLTGTTVEEATVGGWIRQMDPAPPLIHTWDFLRLDNVAWSAFPNLALTELSMIFVVALSSSLDVAAIELELKRPLNYNHELKTVGISNIISGLTGGYTGSYIFSQSIFSLRAGIRSRLAGYVLAFCQIVVLVLPIPILSYVPNFFFGSLLAMICIDLMYEWLWDVRNRITPVEYMICLSTFGLIHLLSVEYGILAGVALYLGCRKLGFDVGVAKFSTHTEAEDGDDSWNDLHLEIDNSDGATIIDRSGPIERYGTI